MKMIDAVVSMCIQREYVSKDNAPWLRYALEKKIVSLMAFVPLVIIGSVITNPATAFTFIITFCVLRIRTNGYHAKSASRCISYSILAEVFFLKVLPMVLNNFIAFVALTVSIVVIVFFAPYNHPDMNLSSEEVTTCAKSAKWRLSMLILALAVLYCMQQRQLADGILLGIVMTASTLVIARVLSSKKRKGCKKTRKKQGQSIFFADILFFCPLQMCKFL